MYKYYYLVKTLTGAEKIFIGTSIKETETLFNVKVITVVGQFYE